MDRTVEVVRFVHPALRADDDDDDDEVRVFQNMDDTKVFDDIVTARHDATARWVWPGAMATASWLCERGNEWIKGKRVVDVGSGTGLLGERENTHTHGAHQASRRRRKKKTLNP